MSSDPSDLITPAFPSTPFSFDDLPNGKPRHLLLLARAVGQELRNYLTNVLIARGMVNVTMASGFGLDLHGLLAGVPRLDGEPDGPYRLRIQSALYNGKLTLQAISAVATAYFASITPVGEAPPIVVAFDIFSDPVSCAQIFYTDPNGVYGNPVRGDIVIKITYPYPTDAFYLDESYLDSDDAYLVDVTGDVVESFSPELDRLIARTRAAGYNPIYVVGYAATPGGQS